MPFEIEKVKKGFFVENTKTKRRFSKKPLTHDTAKQQLHAIESSYTPITAKLFISTLPNKKYRVVVSNGSRTKTMHFGASDYEDYTQHGDRKRKNLYIARHRARENWDDAFTPGYWAKHLLWNKPTVEKSIADIRKNHGVDVLGAGLWDKIKSVPGKIKGFFTGRDNYPPKCREFLAKYGSCAITSIRLCIGRLFNLL